MALSDKVAVVTGAARGIGLAIAQRLLAEGYRVVLSDIDEAALHDAVTSMNADGAPARCTGVVADVTSRASVDELVSRARSAFGRIDVAVINAGTWKQLTNGPFWQIPVAEWQRTFAVNTEGAFNCAAAVAPQMMEQKGGRIIFIGSSAVGEALSQITHYTASKAALIGLMRCAARDLGKFGVTVNMVNPGMTDTGFFSDAEFQAAALKKFVPKVMVPADLTGIVAFLAGPDSGFITAQQFNVDGGGVFS